MRIILIFLFVILVTSVAKGQSLVDTFEKYDVKEGLPQSYVSDVVQDQYGFMWIATLDGLARYNGQNFQHFNVGLNADMGFDLSTSQVVDLHMGKNGMLWILHFNQVVDRLNTATLVVTKDIKPVISKSKSSFMMKFDEDNKRFHDNKTVEDWFYFDENNYLIYDTTFTNINALFNVNSSEFDAEVLSYCFLPNKVIFLLTSNSLINYDFTENYYEENLIPKHLLIGLGESIYCESVLVNDSLLLFSLEDRLIEFDLASKIFKEVSVPNRYERKNKDVLRSIKGIQSLHKDDNARVIFELKGNIYQYKNSEVSLLWIYPNRESFDITKLALDKTNSLWVGTNTNGLYKVNLNKGLFSSSAYQENFLVDLLLKEFDFAPANIPKNWWLKAWAYGLRYEYDSEGDLYFTQESYGYGQDRVLYKLSNNQMVELKAPSDPELYFTGVTVNDRGIWAIDNYGYLFRWENDASEPQIIRIKEIDGIRDERILDLISDNQNLWVLSLENKLYKLLNGEIIKEFNPGDYNYSFVDLCQDRVNSDILWISTLGGGLIKWSKSEEKTLKIYKDNDGLPSNSTVSLKMASDGKLWIATFDGIASFNTKTEVFVHFTMDDGIIESEFNRHHGLELPDGRIAFGGTLGYSIFDPLLTTKDPIEPSVAFSSVSINNQPTGYSLEGIINKPLNQIRTIELDYTIASISFDVAIMQYTNVDLNKLRYKLKGLSEDWIDLGRDRKIRFDQLPVGSYSLIINASNTTGQWSSRNKDLIIVMTPPPWFSWWAITLYIALVMALLVVFWIRYKRKLQHEQETAYAKREADRLLELDEIKTRFFSNITHEFRTPLTLILSPLEKILEQGDLDPKIQKLLKSNYRNGQQLLALVNELLDIGKLDSGSMQSYSSSGDLAFFVQTALDPFRSLADDNGLQLSFRNDNVTGNYLFDKGFLEKILNNLLSNALKFTEEGTVEVILAKIGQNEFQLIVKDSGIGIAKSDLDNLFDRFYQVDSAATRKHEGTGIGLALVKELVDLMQGELIVESELGVGSTFSLKLNLEKVQTKIRTREELTAADLETSTKPDEALLMVVEDNYELRQFIVESLSDRWRVIEAANGTDAEDMILRLMPDLVISDVMMPGIDGYELCKRIKNDFRTDHINFIILSAKTAQESKLRGLEAGADDYITKPFHAKELLLRVNNAIKTQEEVRQHWRSILFSSKPNEAQLHVDDEFLDKTYLILESRIADSSFSVENFAEELSMSKSTLNRKLRSLLDSSANELIRRHRVQKATEYIALGYDIARVGYEVGFESPSYFSKCFKEAYGMTPSEYASTELK